jgi:molybdopterin-guanine dinucleotide biosynthesis protein A
MKISAFILAGGKSSRMGSDKGLVVFRRKKMVQHVINKLMDSGFTDPVIVSNNYDYKEFGLEVIEDVIKDKGPLGGIYSALMHSKTDLNLIISCDVPFIQTKVIELLINNIEDQAVTVLCHDYQIHPLIGVYNKKVLKNLKRHLDEDNLKVLSFIQFCGVKIIDTNDYFKDLSINCFENINTKNDLLKLEQHV